MKHAMLILPYAQDALAPRMSAETLAFHHGKHLQTYIDNLNRLVEGTPMPTCHLKRLCKKPMVRCLTMRHKLGTTFCF